MNNPFILSVLGGALLLASSSCTKSSDTIEAIDKTNDGTFKIYTEGEVTTVQNLVADTIIGISSIGQPYGSGRFSYFSLENKTQVPQSDSASLNWDIALRGTTILTNGGTSGPGGGGAFIWVGAFDQLTSLPPDSMFRTDKAPAYAITTGSGKGWYNYDGPTNLVTPLPGRVLVIRTAKGRYAKVEILNYYKKGQTPAATDADDVKIKNQRYYLLRYTYQPDGSKNF